MATDLATAADLADIVSGAAVAGGIAFALVQLRNFQRQRHDAATLAFLQGWSDPAILDMLDRVYALPDAAEPRAVDEAEPVVRQAANGVYLRFEHLGLMVYHRLVTLEAANEWAGGAARVSWRKLRPWIEAKRAAARSERPGEWFQWLAERLEALPARDETVGAHAAHRDWRP